MKMLRVLSLIVMGAGLVSCRDASAASSQRVFTPPVVHVDSKRHVVCYIAEVRGGYGGTTPAVGISCVALDSTNSHAR